MATYAYQQNYFTASEGYVKYNISPDFGTPIMPGETVTVTGIAYCSIQANTVFKIGLCNGTTYTSIFKTACMLNINIPKGKATSFTATFEMPVLKDDIFGTDRLRYAWICFGLCNENGNGDETVAVDAQKVSYLTYSINPKIIGADFVRCALMGETYKANDEGTKAFGSLSISLADGYTASDITIAKAVITPAGGASTSVSIAQSILASALTATGYSEINSNGEVTITPSTALFSTYTFDTAYDYDIKITIGDAYNTYSYDFDIARSFANVHLSGNAAGGVCFGGFCDSDNPGRFECHYPAYFYNGIFGSGSTQGGISDAVTVKQNAKTITVTFPTAFDSVPMVMICMNKAADTDARDRYMGYVSAFVADVTTTGFTVRVGSNSSNAYDVSVRWIAMTL